MQRSTIIIILLVILFIIGIWFSQRSKSGQRGDATIEDYFTPGVDHDTIYFQVIDKRGQISYLHDSGVKPSTLGDSFDLRIVKKEYNEGKVREIGFPNIIKYGQQITDLKHAYQILPDHVKDKGLYYIVTVVRHGGR